MSDDRNFKKEKKVFDFKISKHQVKILDAMVSELVEWAHSDKFAHEVTLDLLDDRVKKMVADGLIHKYQEGQVWKALELIFRVVVKNKYSPAEYREKVEQLAVEEAGA